MTVDEMRVPPKRNTTAKNNLTKFESGEDSGQNTQVIVKDYRFLYATPIAHARRRNTANEPVLCSGRHASRDGSYQSMCTCAPSVLNEQLTCLIIHLSHHTGFSGCHATF